MAAPIILWNPTAVKESDDAGNSIVKTTLAPPARAAPQYKAYDPERPRKLSHVPKLVSFCIRALSKYPEQLHQLGSARLYFDRKKGGTDGVLRAVLPKWKTTNFSLLDVDPRLWATIVQIYKNPPSLLSSYPLQLSDPHVPLLNQIPATPDFALLTVLDLNGSKHLTNANMLSLKLLHNLTALDVSRCLYITAHGIHAFSRTLTFNELGEKRGPWALRILKMRWCWSINKEIFGCLHRFPLLSVVDLRDTSCRVEDIERPFFSASDGDIFELPIGDAIKHLTETHKDIYTIETPFILSLQDEPLPSMAKQPGHSRASSSKTPLLSKHNSFVVLPPSRGASFSGRPMAGPIQYGNIDTIEFKEKQAKKEEWEYNFNRNRRTDEGYEDEDDGDDEDDWSDVEPSSSSDSENYSEDASNDDGVSVLFRTNLYNPSDSWDAHVLSAAQRSGMWRIEEVHSTSPAEMFYQERPYTSPRRRPRNFKAQAYDLALLRVPPTWQELDAITPESNLAEARRVSSDKRERLGEATLMVKGKRKATMHALQSQLSKRRKMPSMINSTLANGADISPPPSPTATLCDEGEMPIRQRPAFRPISNLQPPPRTSFAGTPRMKLEPAPKSAAGSSSKPPARFSGVVRQGTSKPRDTSLVERFKVQARKVPVSPFTGVSIKAPKPKDSSREFKFLKRRKGESTKPTSAVGARGFNWNNWRKE